MSFPRPSLPSFRQTIRQQFQARFPSVDLTQPNSVLGVLCDVFAGTIYSEFGYLDFLAQQLLPDSAETDYLDRWATIFALHRNAALSAVGNIVVSGLVGAPIPIGTALQDVNANAYLTQPTFTVTNAVVLSGGAGYANGTFSFPVFGGVGTTAAVLNVTIAGHTITTVNSVATQGSYVDVPSPATLVGGGGFSPISVSALSVTSTTANATTAVAHGYTTGQNALIAGAVPAAYNGTFTITVVDSTHFSYSLGGSPVAATGTITATIPLVHATFDLTTTQESAGAPIGAGGTATVQVEAVVAGAAGNQAASAPISLVTVIPNIIGTALFDSAGATGGTDQEGDASLRARVLQKIQQPPQGGAVADYIEWTLATPGVGATRVFVFPLGVAGNAPGTVTVLFVCDGRATQNNPAAIIPTAADVDNVSGYINNLRPVTAQVTVLPPTPVTTNFVLHIFPDNPTLRANVTSSLFDLFSRASQPGGIIFASQVVDAIMQVPGIAHTVVTSPGDIDMSGTPASIAVMGTISW